MKRYFFIWLICVGISCWAQEIIADAEYFMSDGETPSFAEDRALEKAKRNAVEQAGTYIQSNSVVQEYQLVVDEVIALAGGLIEVNVLEEKRYQKESYLVFFAKISAVVDTSDIEEIREMIANGSLIEDHQQLQQDYNQLQQEMDQLKQQLEQLKTQQQQSSDDNPDIASAKLDVLEKMSGLERKYQARRMYERAVRKIRKGRREDRRADRKEQANDRGRNENNGHDRGQDRNKDRDRDRNKREERQERYLEMANRLDPKFVNPLVQIADLHERRGDKQRARFFLDKAQNTDYRRFQRLSKPERRMKSDRNPKNKDNKDKDKKDKKDKDNRD